MGTGVYYAAKAALAQVLLKNAWTQAKSDDGVHKPWPWADIPPVGRLIAPGVEVDQVILEGTSGEALAFGPGQMSGLARPGEVGTTILAGHRDSHFSFLRHLEPGDPLAVETRDGAMHRYIITAAEIVDTRKPMFASSGGDESLLLVTCYPFDATTTAGPLRYVVTAVPVNETDGGISG